MKALIDGDIILYSGAFSIESKEYQVYEGDRLVISFKYKRDLDDWGRHSVGPELDYLDKDVEVRIKTTVGDISEAINHIKQAITSILSATGADRSTIYLTGDGNYREDIATLKPYKGNRYQDKPKLYYEVREWLLDSEYDVVMVKGKEADDMLAVQEGHEEEIIACTIDKDLDGCPGWHYNWNKGQKYFVSEEQADKFFYTQLLVGDTTDNIQGLPRVGPATATKILGDSTSKSDLYSSVWKAYNLYYTDAKVAWDALLENAELLWIHRRLDERWSAPEHE